MHRIRDKYYGEIQATMQAIRNIVANDDKGRFQICGEVNEQGIIYDYFAIRACSGHGIPWLEPSRMSCHLDRQDLDVMGCITHVTTRASLVGIFRGGLIPGGAASRSVRAETNFGCYFPDDRRRLVKGRVGQKGFDVTIILDKDRLFRSCDLYLSPNGVLLTKDVVSPLCFHSIVEHSHGNFRLIYHQLLMNQKIEGFYGEADPSPDPSGRTSSWAGGEYDNARLAGRPGFVCQAGSQLHLLRTLYRGRECQLCKN